MHPKPYSAPQTGPEQRALYTDDPRLSLYTSASRDLSFTGFQPGYLPGHFGHANVQCFQQGTAADAQALHLQALPDASLAKKARKLRLSFVTASDQERFEELFRSAVGDSIVISGEIAKSIMSKSCLTPSVLAKIWEHADTTKSGQLMMPEFVLAMHLCNMAMSGKSVPDKIPDTIYEEVFDVVSSILLSVPDTTPSYGTKSTQNLQPLQTPQPGTIQQAAGFQTSFLQPPGSFQPHFSLASNVQPQVHLAKMNYVSPVQSPLMAVPNYSIQMDNMASQGQWSNTNVPQRKLSGIYALQSQLMPHSERKEEFATMDLFETDQLTWAIKKDEKQVYDNIFKAWGGHNTGFISGKVAVEIFNQSGLSKKDLELIWNLADSENRGKLNIDEFSIALHLIYRKLNKHEIPLKLPKELALQSSKNFSDSIDQVKSLLRNLNSHEKKTFSPQVTDYTKPYFPSNDPFQTYSKNISASYHNKTDRISDSYEETRHLKNLDLSLSNISPKKESINQSNKFGKNKDLDAASIQNEDYESKTRKNKNEIKHLYRQIRHVQEEINTYPDSSLLLLDLDERHKALKYELEDLSDELPSIISKIRKVEQEIADAKLKLFKLRDSKKYPKSNMKIAHNKEIQGSDKGNIKASEILKARMAVLTGDLALSEVNDHDRRYSEAVFHINKEKESNENVILSVEESAEQLKKDLEDKLRNFQEKFLSDSHERKKWNQGIDVQNEVKEFISDLKKTCKAPEKDQLKPIEKDQPLNTSIPIKQSAADSLGTKFSETIHKQDTSHDSVFIDKSKNKAAWIKAEAERRMNERLSAMGIEPYKKPENLNNSLKVTNEKQLDEVEKKKKENKEYETGRNQLLQIEKPEESFTLTNVNELSTSDIHQAQDLQGNENVLDQHSKILDEKLQEEKQLLAERIAQEERIKKLKEDIKQKNAKKNFEMEKTEKRHSLHAKEEKLRKLKEEMEARKQEEMMLIRKRDEMEKEIEKLSLENKDDNKIEKDNLFGTNIAQVQHISETNPFLQYDRSELYTSLNKPNNPFSNLVDQNKSNSSLDTLHTASSMHHLSPKILPTTLETSCVGHQKDLKTWSISRSTSDNDSSDDSTISRKSPAQLASILIGTMEAGRKSPYLFKTDTPNSSTTESSKIPSPPSFAQKKTNLPSTADRHALLNQIQKGTKLRKTPIIQPRSSSILGKVYLPFI
ncbi:hypothetical protein PORY_001203 [Pneumocystis oryctolagi]|uniref:Uncharacterized protein n=1 Tax=Pneumocystis oryctolagi TaxID=42067 RepID=A0ACB7CEZ0_9ASCO|nr:hypothetical protein PORY_001203 [Pneumocystis oryctolagi]